MKIELDLDPKTIRIIKDKAKYFEGDLSDAVDWMVQDFSPSSQKEIDDSGKRRTAAFEEFMSLVVDPTPRQIWMHGHTTGWHHFQIRKQLNPFRQVVDE